MGHRTHTLVEGREELEDSSVERGEGYGLE